MSFSGWKNMSLAKLGWGVMGAIGLARDWNWFITIAFCFTSIHISLARKLGFVDLCVWIYLVWWAIITCGRKYQLSEVDAHMDQLLLALLIGHISLILPKSKSRNPNMKPGVQKFLAQIFRAQLTPPNNLATAKTWANIYEWIFLTPQ